MGIMRLKTWDTDSKISSNGEILSVAFFSNAIEIDPKHC